MCLCITVSWWAPACFWRDVTSASQLNSWHLDILWRKKRHSSQESVWRKDKWTVNKNIYCKRQADISFTLRHSQLLKHPTPKNPPLSLRPQPLWSLLHLTSSLAASAAGFKHLLAVTHPSVDKHTIKADTSFSGLLKWVAEECVCVWARGDGEVHQDSRQQAYCLEAIQSRSHTNSCYGNNGSSSLNTEASCQGL